MVGGWGGGGGGRGEGCEGRGGGGGGGEGGGGATTSDVLELVQACTNANLHNMDWKAYWGLLTIAQS